MSSLVSLQKTQKKRHIYNLDVHFRQWDSCVVRLFQQDKTFIFQRDDKLIKCPLIQCIPFSASPSISDTNDLQSHHLPGGRLREMSRAHTFRAASFPGSLCRRQQMVSRKLQAAPRRPRLMCTTSSFFPQKTSACTSPFHHAELKQLSTDELTPLKDHRDCINPPPFFRYLSDISLQGFTQVHVHELMLDQIQFKVFMAWL